MSPRLKAFGLFVKSYQKTLATHAVKLANTTVQLGRQGIKISGEGLKQSVKNRREAGRALVQIAAKKPAPIDRIVNARGSGIRFIKRGGRIIPIRGK